MYSVLIKKRVWIIAIVLGLLANMSAASELFSRPSSIEIRVAFWKRIYTQVGTNGGLIHDSRNLSIVYGKVMLPEKSRKSIQDRHIKRSKEKYRDILKKIASGKRNNLNKEEQRILSLFSKNVTDKELRAAASRIRFQLGQANRFREGLSRMGYWETYIRNALRKNGLPEALVAIPHVESSFNPKAYSHAGASGIWQFTRSTGRLFMRVNNYIDERRDPFIATDAAIELLAKNYKNLGTWPLAITAYNHGPAGVRRAVRKIGTRDIGKITERYRSRSFGFASRNFYSEFLAAMDIEENPNKFFKGVTQKTAQKREVIEMQHFYEAATLSQVLGIPLDALRSLNPALLAPIWSSEKHIPKGYYLRIPDKLAATAQLRIEDIPDSNRFSQQTRDRRYRVKKGDTLSIIARRFGTTESALVASNRLRNRHLIRAGQVLNIPQAAEARTKLKRRQIFKIDPIPPSGFYVVRSGDNLERISKRFGLTVRELVRINNLKNQNRIRVGQVLHLSKRSTDKKIVSSESASNSNSTLEHSGSPHPTVTNDTKRGLEEDVSTLPSLPLKTDPKTFPINPKLYTVIRNNKIEVQPEETLGHYAEWLNIPTSRLRRLNTISRSSSLRLGQSLKLDFSKTPQSEFIERRLGYHRNIQSAFYGNVNISGFSEYVLRRGDSLWNLSQHTPGIPIWLIQAYNPHFDFSALRPGERLRIPNIGNDRP